MIDEETDLIQFIQNHQDDFYRFCYSYVKDSYMAMDIVQDAIVKAIENYSRLRKKEYIKTWFYRIMINECKLYLRKRKIYDSFDEQEVVHTEINIETVLGVQQVMQNLPSQYKDIVYLRYYEDMTLDEISQTLHTNVNTVKSRLYKALKMMRVDLENNEGCDDNER